VYKFECEMDAAEDTVDVEGWQEFIQIDELVPWVNSGGELRRVKA